MAALQEIKQLRVGSRAFHMVKATPADKFMCIANNDRQTHMPYISSTIECVIGVHPEDFVRGFLKSKWGFIRDVSTLRDLDTIVVCDRSQDQPRCFQTNMWFHRSFPSLIPCIMGTPSTLIISTLTHLHHVAPQPRLVIAHAFSKRGFYQEDSP